MTEEERKPLSPKEDKKDCKEDGKKDEKKEEKKNKMALLMSFLSLLATLKKFVKVNIKTTGGKIAVGVTVAGVAGTTIPLGISLSKPGK